MIASTLLALSLLGQHPANGVLLPDIVHVANIVGEPGPVVLTWIPASQIWEGNGAHGLWDFERVGWGVDADPDPDYTLSLTTADSNGVLMKLNSLFRLPVNAPSGTVAFDNGWLPGGPPTIRRPAVLVGP